MFQSLCSMATVQVIYYRRSSIEEHIISVCAFFRPLTIWKRFYCIQMLSISYLIMNFILMIIINCCPWFPNITKIDSNWHYYQRLDTKFLTNLFHSNPVSNKNVNYFNSDDLIDHYYNTLTSITSTMKTDVTTTTTSTSIITPTTTVETTISDSIWLDKRDIETNEFEFNINPPEISLESIDYMNGLENETMIINDLTTTTAIFINETENNDHDYDLNENLTLKLTPVDTNTSMTTLDRNDNQQDTTFINPFVSSLSIMNIDWAQWIFYYLDFIFQLMNLISLILIKTFHLSISLLIILKCWQLYREIILHRKQSIYSLNNESMNGCCNGTINNEHDQDHHRKKFPANIKQFIIKFNRNNLTKTETERLILLTRLLKKNIQCYEQIWIQMLTIWIILAGISLLTLIQFYHCNSIELNNDTNDTNLINNEHSIKFTNETNHFKSILKWLTIAVHLQDLILLIGFYGLIRFILKRCICLTNCL